MNENNNFVEYYKEHSISDQSLRRFQGIRDSILYILTHLKRNSTNISVADIGCNAGTQMFLWSTENNNVYGVDINYDLVQLALERARKKQHDVQLCVGSASSLSWKDSQMDVCLLPELLEHVVDWKNTINEAIRVLNDSGVIFISTTNVLCPIQAEFNLPLYSWYPKRLKKYYEKLSVTSRPELVCFAKYPAVHWFSYYQLRKYFKAYGFDVLDRFDILDMKTSKGTKKILIKLVRMNQIFRFLGHLFTPYTVIVAFKK